MPSRPSKPARKEPLIFLGVRVPKSIYSEMEQILHERNRNSPSNDFVMAYLVRELLSLGLQVCKKKG